MLAYLIVACLLITPFYFTYKPPSWLVSYLQKRWPDVLFKVPTKSKIVALTIDDSPSLYTREILEILNSNEANATFFIIGSQISGFEATLQSLVSSGNELGNHAMYDEPSRYLSDSELVYQITSVESLLDEVYTILGQNKPARYFRPGSGWFSKMMRETLGRLGYRLILGSVYPHDPQISSPKINAWHILSMAQPGAIIICHDRRKWTPRLLQIVLPELRRRGYRVVTITELLANKT